MSSKILEHHAIRPTINSPGDAVCFAVVHFRSISLSSVTAKTLKTIFTAFWHGAQHKRDSVEKKVAVSLVVSLNKAIN